MYGIVIAFVLICLFVFIFIRSFKSLECVEKPWGWYRNLATESNYNIKILTILPGESTSLQSHKYRVEVWTVGSGEAWVEYGNLAPFKLKLGDSLKVLPECKHRVTNNGDVPLIISELWYGEILDENDIVRHEDRYGR